MKNIGIFGGGSTANFSSFWLASFAFAVHLQQAFLSSQIFHLQILAYFHDLSLLCSSFATGGECVHNCHYVTARAKIGGKSAHLCTMCTCARILTKIGLKVRNFAREARKIAPFFARSAKIFGFLRHKKCSRSS